MKKKFKVLLSLVVFILMLPVMFLMTACNEQKEPEFRVKYGYVQYSTDGEIWTNLISVEELKGQTGESGQDGDDGIVWTIGEDGYWYQDGVKSEVKAEATDGNGIKSITKDTVNSTKEVTKYIITFDDNSTSSFEVINGINGINGEDGEDLTYENYTVTYNYVYAGLEDFFNNYKTSQTVKSTEWLTEMPTVKDDCNGDFAGWFVQGSNTKIENYDFVGGDVELEARWNVLPSGLYSQTEYVMTWAEIVETYPNAFANEGQIIGEYHTENKNGINYRCYSYLTTLKGKLVIDKSIKEIGKYAFESCHNLTSVYIPDTVTSLGIESFYNCSKLSEVRLSNELKRIESNSFNHDTALEQIDLPEGLETLGNNVFSNTNLSSLTLPSSVQEIGDEVLSSCANFVYNTTDYEGNSGIGMNYLGTKDNPYFALISVDDYTQESYFLKESVVLIADYAFAGADRMTDITIPDSALYIGKNAFVCDKLTNIKLSKNLTKIGQYAFYETKIEKIIIPASITKIEYQTFGGSWHLKEVYIPYSVTEIEAGAFANCSYLEKVEISEANPYYVVENNTIYTRDKTTLLLLCAGSEYDENFVIPETVTTIAQYAFSCCGFKTITIHENITFIGGYAFYDCYNLESINMPTYSYWNLSDGLSIMGGSGKVEINSDPTVGTISDLKISNIVYEEIIIQDPFANAVLFTDSISYDIDGVGSGTFMILFMDWVKIY